MVSFDAYAFQPELIFIASKYDSVTAELSSIMVVKFHLMSLKSIQMFLFQLNFTQHRPSRVQCSEVCWCANCLAHLRMYHVLLNIKPLGEAIGQTLSGTVQ